MEATTRPFPDFLAVFLISLSIIFIKCSFGIKYVALLSHDCDADPEATLKHQSIPLVSFGHNFSWRTCHNCVVVNQKFTIAEARSLLISRPPLFTERPCGRIE
jgi:hypothetical protein